MTREEASTLLGHLRTRVEGRYEAIDTGNALRVLGEERFARLCADPIRKHGPGAGYIYFWNVLDYLGWPDPGSPRYVLLGRDDITNEQAIAES